MADISFLNLGEMQEIPTMQDASVLPAGWYNVIVTESDVKDTKAFDGKYLKLTVKVLKGDFKGRLVFLNINLENKNEIAKQIGLRQLGSLLKALGLPAINDTSSLHNIPFCLKLKIRKQDGYDDQNEIAMITHEGDPKAEPTPTNSPFAATSASAVARAKKKEAPKVEAVPPPAVEEEEEEESEDDLPPWA